MFSDKYKRQIKRALALKKRLAEILQDERFDGCSRPRTYKCCDCNAISITLSDILFMCGKRYCPICQKLKSQMNAKILSATILKYMQEKFREGIPVVPVTMVFTLPHTREDPLPNLLSVLKETWKMLRQGGEKKDYTRNRRLGSKPWWRQFFLAESFTIEIPFNSKAGFHPHIHCLGMRKLDKRPALGTHKYTGAIINPDTPGLRSLWYKYLKIAWRKHMDRDYPIKLVEKRHINLAIQKINYANINYFQDLLVDSDYSQKNLEEIKRLELEKLKQQTPQLLGKEIAALVDIKALFYEDEYGERIPITWLLEREILLRQIT